MEGQESSKFFREGPTPSSGATKRLSQNTLQKEIFCKVFL